MKIYHSKKELITSQLAVLNKKYNTVSVLRLSAIAGCGLGIYFYFQKNNLVWATLAFVFFVAFVFLMKRHARLHFDRTIKEALLKINTEEIDFLENKKLPFENGLEFNDFNHPYLYDLDIFGDHSLFQNLNRTAIFIGKKTLANRLTTALEPQEIIQNQEAIDELSEKIDWRQDFSAFAKNTHDTQASYKQLLQWSQFNSEALPKWALGVMYLGPALFGISLLSYLISSKEFLLDLTSYIFIFNLIILGKFSKRISLEIAHSGKINKTIGQYSLLIQKIENESFTTSKLVDLQKKLTFKTEPVSIHIKKLSELFSKNDTIANYITAILFNGTFLFNVHVLKSLIDWKKEHATALETWLEILGEIEFLNSLANFKYNNPDFVNPVLNTHYQIDFLNMSHPLLPKNTRVGNDVTFHPRSFMILTGSNMSGKSTFLRSLGVNMVLAGAGAVVCATQAQVHPMPILVSMRLSDSLSDSQSYFFAEIKRLKLIMDGLENQPAFVLLDEILRGTNSDDKRNGTIEVVKKVITKKAIGAIATHDIEVCLTTNEYPETLLNSCFEVEIVDNDLYFDYKLREGVCKNKSATFLMEKMGVI